MKRTLLILLAVSASIGLIFLIKPIAKADTSGFDAGRIIDDSVFTNYNSMTSSQIQVFLNSKVTSCDTWGSQASEYGGGTRAQWGAAHNNPAPFVCLKDYSENGKSAAQIIYDTAQQFQINPQVLIVLLQKEQGLVTDTWPLNSQYRTATGYGCPDTAPCDSQYYGLTNQLQWSGRMFRAIMNNSPTWYTPYLLGENYIAYNPISSCGGSTVTIQNRATQALYNYTPYQPNQTTLNAPMGQTVSCGSYGNINFYRYFTSWFGDPKDESENVFNGNLNKAAVLSYNNQLYSFYYNKVNKNLSYDITNTSGTTTSGVLDGDSFDNGKVNSDVGDGVVALQYGDSLQLFYYDRTNGNLRHARLDATGWHFENLDGDAGSISHSDRLTGMNPSAVVHNNNLQLFYYDKSTGDLRHSWADATGWHFENLDGDAGSIARHVGTVGLYSNVLSYGDSLQLFYYDQSNGNLRHSWADATGWHFENLDGDAGSVARHTADVGINPTVADYGGTLQLFYYDQSNGNLRHSWADATGWHFENLDGDAGSVARHNSNTGIEPIVLPYGTSLQLFYYDGSNDNLRHSWADATGWHFENLDGDAGSIARHDADTGISPTVAIYQGYLHIYYYNRSGGNFQTAWIDATGWHFSNLNSTVFY